MNEHEHERELPMLAGIAAIFRWLEELAVIISGPILTAGLAIALVDLLTDGALLARAPMLLYAWAVSQAIGVDAQLVGSAAKARAAIRARRPWAVAGYLTLVALLAYVAYVAALVFATQEADGISTAQALARLGMDGTSWLIQRSAIAVGLVILSGFLRYVAPAETTIADERDRLQRELELEPLRAQVRLRKALGWRDLGRVITQGTPAAGLESPPTRAQEGAGVPRIADLGADTSAMGEATSAPVPPRDEPPEPPEPPDTPPDTPPSAGSNGHRRDALADAVARSAAIRLLAPQDGRARRARGKLSREDSLRLHAFALLDSDPSLSKAALRAALRCRREVASRLYAEWQHARAQRTAQAAQ
jgi:hypothetical protein